MNTQLFYARGSHEGVEINIPYLYLLNAIVQQPVFQGPGNAIRDNNKH
jgi:hypothetical protein